MFFICANIEAQESRFFYVNGGNIVTYDDTTICVDDEPDPINVNVYGAFGFHKKWIITDSDNNILALPQAPPFNLNDAGPGLCKIWHISYLFVINLDVGINLNQLFGWYDLSNPIEVYRNQPEGGVLEGGPFEFCVGDGIADNIDEGAITLSGNSGGNSQWVITDSEGNILGLPPSPYVVDFDGAGDGTCLVWHLSFEDGLEGAVVGNNASELKGCYSLSNPIEVYRNQPEGGVLEGGPFEFCVGDGVADNIEEGAISLSGNSGGNSQWVITDSEGNILGLPPSPYVVDFDGAGDGICLVWHLSFEDGLEGAEVGNNANELQGCYSLSNPIEVYRNQPEGGVLEGGPFEFCVGDGVADNIEEGAINLSGNSGGNSQWVITDSEGNILGLPPSPYVVDFDGAGDGTCLVWHLSFEDGLEGAVVGNNANELQGCYSLSNPIEVYRNQPEGGVLEGGPFEFTVGDGVADNIDEGAISLSGNSGGNSQWVITDSEGNILGLPPSPYVVDFDGAGDGICLVWHLSFEDGLVGAVVGNNANELQGCYSLSNPLEVIRKEIDVCSVEGGKLAGGPFEFCVGDGVADNIEEGAISLSENSGGNSQWVITDSEGNILGLPPSPYVVDFDGAGDGTCLVWHLSFEDGLVGAEVGNNANELKGCYSLSNPIEVYRNQPEGGVLEGGPFEFCVGDGIADNIDEGAISLSGNSGGNSQWVITDSEGNILGLPPSPYVVDFDGAGDGTCLVWHLSFEDGLEGAVVGNNASELKGCYSLSNPIEVYRNQPEGGVLEGGPFEFTVGDGVADNIEEGAITLSGNSGGNSQWVITDSEGNILGLPPSPYVVDFDGAGDGTCLVWHLSFEDGLVGAVVGNNANELQGCYSLSNPLEVIRKEIDVCNVEGGKLSSKNYFVFCVGDDEPDYVDGIELVSNSGENSQWVITDLQGEILGLPESPEDVDFNGAGEGICLIWHLSYSDSFAGADIGNNAFTDLEGCYNLSNPLPVFRFPADGFLCELFSYTFNRNSVEIKMYPNPASTKINLDLSNISEDVNVKIFSYSSIEVFNRDIQIDVLRNKELNIDVSKFNSGFYLVSITDTKGSVKAVKRLIIE
ncbi:T9SS type A sorting domain-containing protein [uncultured Psychroserpens sp.]|uniref:T9SS type A sorting domain-containing protein n=1 Tax=uncultured Psychroserpens sp. TaxID=255436 RepID=UPI00260FBBB4|nr:T9SS type A sorting domain-containing protein [uncultured Psychroserpens sp.]